MAYPKGPNIGVWGKKLCSTWDCRRRLDYQLRTSQVWESKYGNGRCTSVWENGWRRHVEVEPCSSSSFGRPSSSALHARVAKLLTRLHLTRPFLQNMPLPVGSRSANVIGAETAGSSAASITGGGGRETFSSSRSSKHSVETKRRDETLQHYGRESVTNYAAHYESISAVLSSNQAMDGGAFSYQLLSWGVLKGEAALPVGLG
jgi:hypothetical protein